MINLFNTQMTSLEAQTVLFANVDGKTEEEKKELLEAYKAVIPVITARETRNGIELKM